MGRDKDTSLAIAAIAARVNTIGQARAVLGVAANVIGDAYTHLPDIKANTLGVILAGPVLGWFESTSIDDVRAAAKSRLDAANTYAQQVYAIWNSDPDLQDEEISATNATKVGFALARANDVLKDIQNLAQTDYWNFGDLLNDALAQAGQLAGSAVQSVTNAIAAGTAAFVWSSWPTLLLIAGAVGVYVFRKPIIAAISKVGA